MTQRLAAGGGRISAAPTFSPFLPTTTGVSGDPFGMAMEYMTAAPTPPVSAPMQPSPVEELSRLPGFGGLDSSQDFGGGGDVGPNAPNTQGMSPATLGQTGQVASALSMLGVNPGVLGPFGGIAQLGATMSSQATPQGVLGTTLGPIGGMVGGKVGGLLGGLVGQVAQGKPVTAKDVAQTVAFAVAPPPVQAAVMLFNVTKSLFGQPAPTAEGPAGGVSGGTGLGATASSSANLGDPIGIGSGGITGISPNAAPMGLSVSPTDFGFQPSPAATADFGGGGGGDMGIGGATGIGATASTSDSLGSPIGVGQGGLGLGLGGGQTGVSGSGFAANIGSGGGGGGSASAGDGGFGFGGVSAGDTGNLGFGGGSLGGMASEGGGASSGGGSGGGDKIICTLLYKKGYMPKSIYQADQNFGALLALSDPAAYDGYYRWAKHVVSWMEQDTVWGKFVTAVTRRIAMPWAYAMAAEMGVPVRSSLFGRALLHAGLPFCRFVSPAKQGGYVNGLS